jgi:hypothetical protein
MAYEGGKDGGEAPPLRLPFDAAGVKLCPSGKAMETNHHRPRYAGANLDFLYAAPDRDACAAFIE